MHVLTGSSCPHPFISAVCPLCRGSDAPGRAVALASAEAVADALTQAAGQPEIVLRDGDLLRESQEELARKDMQISVMIKQQK